MSIDTSVYDKNTQVSGIALLEKGEVRDIEIISGNQAISGNVYLGKITKKVTLAQDKEGFFVNIGDGREAFLNGDEYGMNEVHLVEGQSVVVQVAQERHAEKNARLVRSIQLVGTYLVYCPYRMNVEVSAKIEDKTKVDNLYEIVKDNITGQEGWVVRTAAANAETSVLEYINHYKTLGSLVKVITNNRNLEKDIDSAQIEFVISNSPFEEYGIEEAIGEALEKTVALKSGGRVTIEETRACVAIDVDSARDCGGGSLNRLNEEAATEIAKQIRLRNLSGKIVIDFAGHSEFKYIKPLLGILEQGLSDDMTKSRVIGLSHGGLVEIIRVRKRPSLMDLMTEACPTCQGTGRVEKGE